MGQNMRANKNPLPGYPDVGEKQETEKREEKERKEEKKKKRQC